MMDQPKGKAPEIPDILPPEIKGMMTMAMPLLVPGISALIHKIVDRFGDEGWKALGEGCYELGKQSGPMMQMMFNIDPQNASSIAKLVEFMDNLAGVEGEWLELSPEKAVKHDLSCPVADGLRENGISQFCSLLMPSAFQGVLDTIGSKPKKMCLGPKLLCQGDEYCEITIEM